LGGRLIHPSWQFYLKPGYGGFVSNVSEWVVFSGLNKNESSRRSWFHDMKSNLPYAQAILDINELHARRLAGLRAGDLPSGHGVSPAAARADLATRIRMFCEQVYRDARAEIEVFANETNQGQNKDQVRKLGAAIKKRLNALEIAPPPSASAPASPASTVSPLTSPAVRPSPSPSVK
jgi:hypothetical protein